MTAGPRPRRFFEERGLNAVKVKKDLLAGLRNGDSLSAAERFTLIWRLSLPAIMAQLSTIVMQYIDASMVGRLQPEAGASIGLIAPATWLLGGLCGAAVTGFTVQAAQYIGAKDERGARGVMKHGLLFASVFALFLAAVGAAVSFPLPRWLGGDASIAPDAGRYLLIYALSLPAVQLNHISGGMLQASGNMKLPGILHVIMCGLDVIFNQFLIFPSSRVLGINLPGAGMGVGGAALGTALAQLVTAALMLYFLLARSPMLKLRRGEKAAGRKACLSRAVKIAVPVGCEQVIMCGAQLMAIKIVSPLGTTAIAANSFAITAESLCYMPGYGIGAAAVALIGQSIGARRRDLTRRLGWLTTGLGMAVMTLTGVLLYIGAPFMMGLLSTDAAVVELGTAVLRIEAFAEPFYAASIVAAGVFRGAGDTLAPSIMSFCSMWLVRLPIAWLLAPRIGLRGVWIAMCVELCVRGILFLIRLAGKSWDKKSLLEQQN